MAVSGEISLDLPTSGSDTLNIVITGKVGTGKSALVNGLIGSQVTKEQTGTDAVTTKIERYVKVFEIEEESGNKKAITVNVSDTHGLSDPDMDDEQVQEYQVELAGYVDKTDLFLYCVDMRGRIERSDMMELKELTERAGEHIWNNAMIVLTFANKIMPENPDVDPKQNFQSVLDSWKAKIEMQFQRWLNLSEEIIRGIAIVPIGYRNRSPPDRVDWFSRFWGEACNTVKEGARSNLVSINYHRMTTEDKTTKEDKELYQMQINLKEILDNTTIYERIVAIGKLLRAPGRIILKRNMTPMLSGLKYLEAQALERISKQRVSSETDSSPLLDGKTSESQSDPLLDGETSESQSDPLLDGETSESQTDP